MNCNGGSGDGAQITVSATGNVVAKQQANLSFDQSGRVVEVLAQQDQKFLTHVRPTLEIIITESPVHLCKVKDAESGLALISARK